MIYSFNCTRDPQDCLAMWLVSFAVDKMWPMETLRCLIAYHLFIDSLSPNIAGSRTILILGTPTTIAMTTQKSTQRNHYYVALSKAIRKRYKIKKLK